MPTLTERPATPSSRLSPSEEGLRMALAAAQAGIWGWDVDTNQNTWSDEIWPLFGLDRSQHTASFDNWLLSVHPEDRTYAKTTVMAASQCRAPLEIEWRTNPELGPCRWILSRGQPGKLRSGDSASYSGVVMDISARKSAEAAACTLNETIEQRVAERTAALSGHERLLQTILDGVPGVVSYWHTDLVNQFANKAHDEWFGMPPEQIRHRHIRGLLGPELFERSLPHIEAALSGQRQRFEIDMPIPGQTSERRYGETHCLPDIVNGIVQGVLVIMFDISQIKHAELAAEAANDAKSEFLANVSHEVRIPLNAMFGLTQVGARHTVGTLAERTFTQILDAAQHLLALVDDVLDFSKIEAGKLTLHCDRLNLGQVLEHVLALTSVTAQAKGLTLRLIEAPNIPQYYDGDATRLSQILLNLLSNAIKFTNVGEVCVQLTYEAPDLTITVSDTGLGMSNAKIAQLFKPFVQVHDDHPSLAGGTGLGLAITKRIVNMMQGTIDVLSEPGRGATFTVYLPLTSPEPGDFSRLAHVALIGLDPIERDQLTDSLTARGSQVDVMDAFPAEVGTHQVLVVAADTLQRTRPSVVAQHLAHGRHVLVSTPASPVFDLSPELQGDLGIVTKPLSPLRLLNALTARPGRHSTTIANRLQGIRVLAAEDNQVNRLVLGQMLEQEGAIMTFAYDGAHALEQVRVHGAASFDIMLCDIQMPILDGYQTAQALGHIAPTLPIIGLTAHAFDSAKQQAKRVGMVGYVTKPYMLDTLVEEIRKYSRRRPLDPSHAADRPAPSSAPESNMKQDINDWQAMQQYFREQPQLLDRLIGMLTSTLGTIQQELDQAMQTQNLDALAKVAHNIKGTALNLHTPELARLAVQTQEQARQMAQEALQTAETLSNRLQAFIATAIEHQQQASTNQTSSHQ